MNVMWVTDESLAGYIKALGARDTDTRLEAASSLVKQVRHLSHLNK